MASKTDSTTMQEQVYQKLVQSLLQGQLAAGHVLRIRETASDMGTSEMPVREALKRMVAERMIEQRPNRSFVVPEIGNEEFSDIMDVRVTLECQAIVRAARNTSPDLVTRLRSMNETMASAISQSNGRFALRLNQELRSALYNAAGSPTLDALIRSLWIRTMPLLARALRESPDAKIYLARIAESHGRLIDSVEQADGIAAQDILTGLIRSTAELCREHAFERSNSFWN